ncbi:hypothetical protein ACRE_059050 [Hapsidospora chrysogenum ATCC 11550]|uniref:MARVEL domain-containing protein n=1 Tax=Hapsidospora chrysogenum (strain ATCC 11550 / CBS 779.69 / DSM 880 / IAM 14645 / JCM 23072 / IMI 49137) TaxID=857340 RepID=A0A086T1X0_HAPC1|nr:hypothetical protein ACRE_059050 [Hapsidospora chrysogenum ATCC 11550]
MRAGPPNAGALGAAFLAMRVMQAISLLTVIGLSANFVSEAVNANYKPPNAMIGTLVVTVIGTIYIFINYVLYRDGSLPALISAAADFLVMIATLVVAVIVGLPVSYLKCPRYPSGGHTAMFLDSVYENVKKTGRGNYIWVNPDKVACYEIKSIWGLSIALCVLFAVSSILCVCIWRSERAKAGPKTADSDSE